MTLLELLSQTEGYLDKQDSYMDDKTDNMQNIDRYDMVDRLISYNIM